MWSRRLPRFEHRIVATAAALALVVTTLSAAGATADRGGPVAALRSPDATLAWGGSFADRAAPSLPDLYAAPGVCDSLVCREFPFHVDLPVGVWVEPGHGGVQVAVDWAPAEQNDLDLYVYDASGVLVGRSDGAFASTGESLRLRRAGNGTYGVVVVPRLVKGPMTYRGFVEVEYDAAVAPVRPMLPNLVASPARQPHLRTGAYFIDHQAGGTPSCYPDEVAERGARRCLRFDQVIANQGDGPLELRYRMDGLATDQPLRRRVYSSDGSFAEVTVDSYEFHPTHAPFHYKNFGQALLYRMNPDGSLEKVRESRKNGFCLVDVENTRFGTRADGHPYRGEAPRTYYFPRCNTPAERDGGGVAMVNGLAPGWADVYNWFLADQYIEISGVVDGLYVLETIANPARTVYETTLDDNAARVVIQLENDDVKIVGDGGTPAPSRRVAGVELVGGGPHPVDDHPVRGPPRGLASQSPFRIPESA